MRKHIARLSLPVLLTLTLTLVLLAVLCSCGSEQERTYALVLNCDTAFNEKIAEGFTAVMEAAGKNAVIHTPEEMSISEQYEILEQLQDSNVDGIAVIPNSSSSYNELISECNEAGITVVALGSSINIEDISVELFYSDYAKTADELLEYVSEYLGGEGQIAILSSSNQDYAAEEIISELREQLEAGAYPGILLTEIAYGYNEVARCEKKIEHLYETYPDLQMVLTLTSESTQAAAAYIEENELTGELCVAGYGLEEEVEEYLGSSVAFYYTYDPETLGEVTAQILLETDQEEKEYAVGDVIDLGEYGTYEVFAYKGVYAQENSSSYPAIIIEESVTWVESVKTTKSQ